MTWMWPGPLRVSEVQGRNTCYKGGFFSEDSLLSSSPMSFYLQTLLTNNNPKSPMTLIAYSSDTTLTKSTLVASTSEEVVLITHPPTKLPRQHLFSNAFRVYYPRTHTTPKSYMTTGARRLNNVRDQSQLPWLYILNLL